MMVAPVSVRNRVAGIAVAGHLHRAPGGHCDDHGSLKVL